MSRAATSAEARNRAVVSTMRRELYYGRVVNEEALRARFDVIEVDGEGILLDREGGGVYRLNRTACEIWTALAAGQSITEISAQLCQRFGLDVHQAERDTRAALQEIPEAPLKPSADPYRWSVTAHGYGFFEGENLVCGIDAGGRSLRLAAGARPTEAQARGHLKAVVPKILALRDVFVLHASAVEFDDSLLVFSGRSGAGKTTSARAFTRAGARLIAEDLLVLASSPAGPRAVVGGEPAIRAWIAEQGARLARAPEESVSCEPLLDCVDGPSLPISRILLIDADRRLGDQIRLEPLARPDALVALLESAYFASADARQWSARVVPLRDLVARVATSRVTMPDGLPALAAAASALGQSVMTTS
jgi:hypothetical protein